MRPLLLATAFLIAATAIAFPPSDKPRVPREAAAAMTVPDGFKVTLFAGEPDVAQPIAMCFDDRGRLWVAECHTYPKWIKDGSPGNDRILIFEDVDNDGVFDKRTVFMDKLANLTSIEFGFGGIYALTAPNLIHIPFDLKTDRPAGEPKILLDGWSLNARHNIVNGLKWGPDGWLYGCHGILDTSYVGKPGTPKEKRPPINCGVWRFHPVTHKYEIVAHGGTNPWGLDWDEQGELYFTNCVIDHAFHVIPGGHYQRMYGSDFNPHLYKLMGSCVDHLHWAGGPWTSSRSKGDPGGDDKHSEAGGGHAHSGCMIYLGDNFPKEYRNNLFTGNIHGNRLNRDRIDYTNKGSILRHEKDFLFGNDPWFRPIAMDYGPDGGVYVIDWTDTGECHNYDKVHKSGRIYKVFFGKPEVRRIKLSGEVTDKKRNVNEWHLRHARRVFYEQITADNWNEIFRSGKSHALPSFWLQPTKEVLERCHNFFDIDPENERDIDNSIIWHMISRSIPRRDVHVSLDKMRLPKDRIDRSHVAGLLQQLPTNDPKRWKLLELLAANAEDRLDPQIPLLLWYAAEPLPEIDPSRALKLVKKTQMGILREFTARRFASLSDPKRRIEGTDAVLRLAVGESDHPMALDILKGVHEALRGFRDPPKPKAWEDASFLFRKSPIQEVRDAGMTLGVLYGDPAAYAYCRKLIKDPTLSAARRLDAFKSLAFKNPDGHRDFLNELLDDTTMRSPAIRALAAFDDIGVANRLVQIYPKLSNNERTDAIATLSSRPAFALALLDAVADKTIDRKELGPVEIRQLVAIKDPKVTARVEEVWGTIRPAGKDKIALMAKFKKLLAADEVKAADPVKGRLLFTKHCATCHKLFGEGTAIGPDITGAQRGSLDYLLENILDPSAIVPREYRVHVVTTTSGRTITGIVKDDNDRALTIQTANELVTIPKPEIDTRTASTQSMMPDGVLEQMPIADARALIAYLQRAMPLAK